MADQDDETDKKERRRRSVSWHIYLRYIVVATVITIFAALIVRSAVMTTVVHADKWRDKANKELQRVVEIPPTRGDILAHDGSVLATNLRYYTLRIDFRASNFKEKQLLLSLDSLCDSLAKYHPQRTAAEWKAHFNTQLVLPDTARTTSFTILRDITHAEAERVRRTFPFFHIWANPNKTGLVCENRMKRSYPYGEMARRSIGRVGQTKECSEVHGISGLEKALDTMLFGVPGRAKKVPLTHNITNWTDVPPVHGATLRTTIDIGMQDILENELNRVLTETEAQWGTALLMEVSTGDIRAISNLERDKDGRYIEAMNRALMGYEPGSVMKAISMVVALEDGFVTNLDQVYSIGSSYVYGGGSPIRDSHSPAMLPVRRFLEYSSNIGMTKLVAPHFAKNPNGFRERLRKLGLLDPLNTGIAGETPPYFPPLDPERGALVSLGRQTYGYASQIPPLYMCAFYNAIANDGKFVRPRIVEGIIRDGVEEKVPVSYVNENMCSAKNARLMREMLHEVVWGQAGTAKKVQSKVVEIAGKTGTARIAREISPDELERSRKAMAQARTHADSVAARPHYPGGYNEGHYRYAFCGFFPYDKPKYTCMVLISDPHGPRNAGMNSGQVLLNTALRLHSRGLLDNVPDYAADAQDRDGAKPLVYASADAGRRSALTKILGTSDVNAVPVPKDAVDGTVPDVVGMSVRDAVARLEKAGYNVATRGTGVVVAQQPAAGSRPGRGARIALKLTN